MFAIEGANPAMHSFHPRLSTHSMMLRIVSMQRSFIPIARGSPSQFTVRRKVKSARGVLLSIRWCRPPGSVEPSAQRRNTPPRLCLPFPLPQGVECRQVSGCCVALHAYVRSPARMHSQLIILSVSHEGSAAAAAPSVARELPLLRHGGQRHGTSPCSSVVGNE